jgi:hypothetical protein
MDALTNEPIVGVRVTLATPAASFSPLEARIPPPQATTDSAGRFSLETQNAGRLLLVPTKDGWIYAVPGQSRPPLENGVWVQVSAGLRVQGLQLTMGRPATITGRLVTAEGQPIIGTPGSVGLMRYTYGTDGKRTLTDISSSRIRPDDKGDFRLYDVPPGEYYLCARGGGNTVIGSSLRSCFPGPREEEKAVPIRVRSGEELRMGTLAVLPPAKGIDVKLRLSGMGDSPTRRVRFVEPVVELISLNSMSPGVIGFSVMPGRHDIAVTTDSFALTDLRYAFVALDAGSSNLDQEVALTPAPKIAVKLLIENTAGERVAAPRSIRCSLRSRYGSPNCLNERVLPGIYELELQELPFDAYVLSAKAGERDFLRKA